MERFFGADNELQGHEAYGGVWERDMRDITDGGPAGGESVQDVSARVTTLMEMLEREHEGCAVVLVAHGDTLSILQAVVNGSELGRHTQYGMKNCEIRRLGGEAHE
eukprot:evm.model.scf_1772.2 EVM.evm.TU.scf_1772.2   scf_1772:5839-7036(-)